MSIKLRPDIKVKEVRIPIQAILGVLLGSCKWKQYGEEAGSSTLTYGTDWHSEYWVQCHRPVGSVRCSINWTYASKPNCTLTGWYQLPCVLTSGSPEALQNRPPGWNCTHQSADANTPLLTLKWNEISGLEPGFFVCRNRRMNPRT